MGKCIICGRLLDKDWKTKCYDCFKKTELKGKKDINKLLKKYGVWKMSYKKYLMLMENLNSLSISDQRTFLLGYILGEVII